MFPAVKILTVLRSGGDFRSEHVELLRKQCHRHAPDAEFHCITDLAHVPGRIPAVHDWPHWWSKIEAYRVDGPAVLIDLDTVIRPGFGALIQLARHHEFIALRDLDPNSERELATGFLGWSGRVRELYLEFWRDPEGHMGANMTPRWWGDAGYVERQVKNRNVAYWQDIAPGAVASYKLSSPEQQRQASIVCFHGKPRPWEVDHGL